VGGKKGEGKGKDGRKRAPGSTKSHFIIIYDPEWNKEGEEKGKRKMRNEAS